MNQQILNSKKPPCKLAMLAGTVAMLSLSPTLPAHAEGPMNTDDAGTLDKGGMKIEAILGKDDQEKGGELLFGFSPLENMEMEIGFSRTNDGSTNPDNESNGIAFGAKWVPYQNVTGWSFGARFDYARYTTGEYAKHGYALTGLASCRLENGQVLHINPGVAHSRTQGVHETVGTWGIGYEFPLVEKLQLTVETYGEEHSRPDKAVGLRYEVFDGFKISAAAGQGNEHNFGQAGFAWEF